MKRLLIVLFLICMVFMASDAQIVTEAKIQRDRPASGKPQGMPAAASGGSERGVHFRVSVFDADGKVPIELARIVLTRNGKFVSQTATNPVGLARFINIEPGNYIVQAWFVGYQTFSDSMRIDKDHGSLEVLLHASGNTEKDVDVVGQRELAVTSINLNTGNQTFESETYHPAPVAQMTNLIQENVMGAAAPLRAKCIYAVITGNSPIMSTEFRFLSVFSAA